MEAVQSNEPDSLVRDLFPCNATPVCDQYTEMSDDNWSHLCREYINGLMLQLLVAEKDPEIYKRAQFLISTLRAHHFCRTGHDMAVIPAGTIDRLYMRKSVKELGERLLALASDEPEESSDGEDDEDENESTTPVVVPDGEKKSQYQRKQPLEPEVVVVSDTSVPANNACQIDIDIDNSDDLQMAISLGDNQPQLQDEPASAADTLPKPDESGTNKKKGKRPIISSGECPVCGKQRAHLKAHLTSKLAKHGWSTERYYKWLYGKQAETNKDKHKLRSCPKKCGWVGVKLDYHLEHHHGIEPKSQMLAKLKAKSTIVSQKIMKSGKRLLEEEAQSTVNKKKRLSTSPLNTREVAVKTGLCPKKNKTKNEEKKRMRGHTTSSDSSDDDTNVIYDESDDDDYSSRNDEEDEDAEEVEEHDGENAEVSQEVNTVETDDDGMEEEQPDKRGPYGPSSRPSTVFGVLLRGWNIHLDTPDGTQKSDASIRKMCANVEAIAKAVDPNVKDLSVFMNKENVYKRFFKANIDLREQDRSKGYCSKSLSGFSTSLERFLTYYLSLMRRSLSVEKREALGSLRDVQRSWREAWGKKIAVQRAEVEWEAEKNLPSVEEVKRLLECEHAQQMRKLLTNPHKYNLDINDAISVRNYLIFRINIQNANRAGPIAEITLKTFNNGKMQDDKWTIHISNQKTSRTLGGVILQFSQDLHAMVQKYVKHFRPLLMNNGKEAEDAMFLTSRGTPYSNSHIHHALKQYATKTNALRPESLDGFCSSMIRHVVVTNTRGLSSPEKNDLASKMGHSRSTADRCYNLINKVKAASSAHDTVTSLMEDTLGGNKGEVSEQAHVTASSTKESVPEENENEEKEGIDDDLETHCESDTTNTIAPSENARSISIISIGRRRHFASEDTKKLQTVCHDEITSDVVPTRTSIIRKLRGNQETSAILQAEGAERVYQKVKHLRRNCQVKKGKK